MPTLTQPSDLAEAALSLETVIESQDDRWVVIARYCDHANVVRARTRSFATYAQARQYEADLKEGRTL